MDGDGDLDYFVGNLGLNSKFKAKKDKPFQIFCDDFDKNGTYDVILTSEYKGNLVPMRGRECTSQQMPNIKQKFKTFESFATADLNSILGEENLENALHLQADILYSIYLENKGNGEFSIVKLPNQVQISPILDFQFLDIDKDGQEEIISVGNMYNTEVETVRYDASYGNIMKFENGEFKNISVLKTGFSIRGDSKIATIINLNGNKKGAFITNNDGPISTYILK